MQANATMTKEDREELLIAIMEDRAETRCLLPEPSRDLFPIVTDSVIALAT